MSDPIYVVERLNWRRVQRPWIYDVPGDGPVRQFDFRPVSPLRVLLPGGDPISTFALREEAEAAAREREWELRRRINPFHCGGPYLHYQTSFDDVRLFDYCLDLGLHPPKLMTDSQTWQQWWDENEPAMTPLQRASFWESLDRVRFFRVRPQAEAIDGFVIGWRHFAEDPLGPGQYGNSHYVGSSPEIFVRSSDLAIELCQHLFAERLAREGGYYGDVSNPPSWIEPDFDPFAETGEPVYFDYGLPTPPEYRPLMLFASQAPRPAMSLYIVCRRHWRLELDEGGSWRWSLIRTGSSGRPIAAFDTLAAADERMVKWEREARDTVSSFRFGPPHEWSHLHMSDLWGMLSEIAPIDFTSLWQDYNATDRMWCGWWDGVLPDLSPEQIALAWSLYDRLRFYEVVEVEYRE